jgi:hypothetical protein
MHALWVLCEHGVPYTQHIGPSPLHGAHTKADTENQIRSDVCEAIYLRWNRFIVAFVFGILVIE